MGLFSFLDERVALAKWTHGRFVYARTADPKLSAQQLVDFAIYQRVRVLGPKAVSIALLNEGRRRARDVFSVCYLFAQIEILPYHKENLTVESLFNGEDYYIKTKNIIDKELIRLGNQKLDSLYESMMSLYDVDPQTAEIAFGQNPYFKP